jgi:hypothetical protein
MSSKAARGDAKSVVKHRHFLTAFALLSHSVSYLAWSQGVLGVGVLGGQVESSDSDSEDLRSSTILISATSLLQLIAALGDSPSLGARSHEPGRGNLTHMGFSLDVNQVVGSVLSNEIKQEGHSDWDMVEHA